VARVTDDFAATVARGSLRNDGRGVIDSAFELLDHVAALEPVRLLDLANVSGIPRETVRRLLQQLIAVGAVSRDGTRYRLGASLLGLGAQVGPERRLRVAARRPIAELAFVTGAAVQLSAMIGGEVVYLDAVDARVSFGVVAQPGARVPPRCAAARVHTHRIGQHRTDSGRRRVDGGCELCCRRDSSGQRCYGSRVDPCRGTATAARSAGCHQGHRRPHRRAHSRIVKR
jgi:IclR helix-turn-helix domain